MDKCPVCGCYITKEGRCPREEFEKTFKKATKGGDGK